MTSGGNNFNYPPENQLTKFKLCLPTSLFFPPRISVTHFGSPEGCLWTTLSAEISPCPSSRSICTCTCRRYSLTVFKSESTADSAQTQRHCDVFIRCTFRFMLSLLPPPPRLIKKLVEFEKISRPTLAEVGWARAHPCPPVATPVFPKQYMPVLWGHM